MAISCWPRILRTISSPLAQGRIPERPVDSAWAIRPDGDDERLLRIDKLDWALARAAAKVAMDSLVRCMAALRVEEVETDGAGFRALGADAMADRLPRILGYQAFEFGLGLFMLEMG